MSQKLKKPNYNHTSTRMNVYKSLLLKRKKIFVTIRYCVKSQQKSTFYGIQMHLIFTAYQRGVLVTRTLKYSWTHSDIKERHLRDFI